MIISTASTKSDDPLPLLTCKSQTIELVSEFKYLGIIFDSTLSFKNHYKHVCGRVSSAAGCLIRIKRFLNLQIFKVLINSFVMSIIDYGIIIWGNLSNTQIQILQSKVNTLLGSYFYPRIINRLQKINRTAHSYDNRIYNAPPINYIDLHEKCNLLTISEPLQYFYGVFAFKSVRLKRIPLITVNFVFSQISRNRLLVPKHDTNFFKKLNPFYQCVLVWNDLSSKVKQIDLMDLSLPKFMDLLNRQLINKRLNEFVTT